MIVVFIQYCSCLQITLLASSKKKEGNAKMVGLLCSHKVKSNEGSSKKCLLKSGYLDRK